MECRPLIFWPGYQARVHCQNEGPKPNRRVSIDRDPLSVRGAHRATALVFLHFRHPNFNLKKCEAAVAEGTATVCGTAGQTYVCQKVSRGGARVLRVQDAESVSATSHLSAEFQGGGTC